MGMPVAVLKRTMTAVEFDQWVKFDAEEPIGDRANFHYPIAALSALVFNRTLQKSERSRKVSDFVLWPEPRDDVEDDGTDGIPMDVLMGDGW